MNPNGEDWREWEIQKKPAQQEHPEKAEDNTRQTQGPKDKAWKSPILFKAGEYIHFSYFLGT